MCVAATARLDRARSSDPEDEDGGRGAGTVAEVAVEARLWPANSKARSRSSWVRARDAAPKNARARTPAGLSAAPGNAGYPAGDSDGDALTDAEEIEIYGTDPNASDTDGDGASDYDEVWAGNDPLVSGISPAGEEGATSAASPSPAPSTSGKAAVTQLPNTGAGLDTEDSASMTGILGVLAAAAMAFGGLVANRRRA